MTFKAARKWIAIYFLLVTVVAGGYLLLFGRTRFLPIDKDQASATFQILIPVLVGQIAVIFQWTAQIGSTQDDEKECPIPGWAIQLPPLLVLGLIGVSVIVLIVGNWGNGSDSAMGPDEFKSVFTFAISVLNASTVFLVGRLFPKAA
jgi:hypothetical protein